MSLLKKSILEERFIMANEELLSENTDNLKIVQLMTLKFLKIRIILKYEFMNVIFTIYTYCVKTLHRLETRR